MNPHREHMNAFLAKAAKAGNNDQYLTDEKYQAIVQQLKANECQVNSEKPPSFVSNPQLKHWIKRRGFQLFNRPELGITDKLGLPRKGKFFHDFLLILHL